MHVAGSFEHTVLQAVLARSCLSRCQNKSSGFSNSTGFVTVRLASGIWLPFSNKRLRLTHRHIGHRPSTSIHALVPRLTRAVRQYFVLCFHNFVLCFDYFVLCFHNFVCIPIILCCVSIILCCLSQILTCVSKPSCRVSRIVCCVCGYGQP